MSEVNDSYTLRITKRMPNPKYNPDHYDATRNDPFLEVESLSVSISTAQFEAIRKAVLEVC